jgi:type IX secretion system PorP/SprF family membrane protein
MKKKFLLAGVLILFLFNHVHSQRIWGSPAGQYAFNPAGAAMNDLGEISSCYHNNYGSAYNNPVGFLLMGSAPLPVDNSGIGFRLTSESGGILKSTMAEGTYIYRIPAGKNSKLSFGLSGVLNQLGIIRERINAQYPNDPVLQGAQSGFWFDANFGVSLYSINKYNIGIAAYNLLGGSTDWLISGFSNRTSRLLTLNGMYSFNVLSGDGKLEISGVGMSYLTDGTKNIIYDISSRVVLKKSFWAGCGYVPGAVKLLLGVYYQNFAIGYSGGIDLGEITKYTYSLPRHELFLKIEFNNSKTSRPQSARLQ